MNAGLFAHCILAYQINLNVWTHLIIHLSAPALNTRAPAALAPGPAAGAVLGAPGGAFAASLAGLCPGVHHRAGLGADMRRTPGQGPASVQSVSADVGEDLR